MIRAGDHVKSELMRYADISKSLHSENGWHLIPKEHCFFATGPSPNASFVFHVCSKSWVAQSNPDERGVEKLTVIPYIDYRLSQDGLKERCQYCDELPPETIQGLWILHNWDYLSLNEQTA